MCFGNKLNQNRPEHCITPFPTPNNFCGGFALNAVLVDLGSGTRPIEVYMRIQDYQNKEIIEKHPEFELDKNFAEGTGMKQILPGEHGSDGFFIARLKKKHDFQEM